MSQHPDGKTPGEGSYSDGDRRDSGGDQDLHPAIDPREPVDPVDGHELPTPPPLDIDEREGAMPDPAPPDVIELSEHAEGGPRDATLDGNVVDDANPAGRTRRVEFHADDEHSESRAPDDSEPAPAPDDAGTAEPSSSATPLSRASSLFAGAASKVGLGTLLETSEDPSRDTPGEPSRDGSGESRSASPFMERVRSYVDPRLQMFSTTPHMRLLAAGLVLILLCLLANSGGLALIVLAAIVPILIVITLTQHDVFEKESNLLVAAVGAGGSVVGLVLSLLSSWIHGSQWFDTGVLHFGAAGFGGRFAEAAGNAPFIVWSLVGLVIPALAIAGIAGIPIGLRRWPQFRNEVMDGMILTGAAGAGFSIGASIVYWWPMIADPGPQTNVSDWTLSIIGVSLARPAVIALCGAMIGAGVWRYMLTPSASMIVLPAVSGIVGYLLLTFGSIQLQPLGIWPEFIWTLLVLAAVFVLYRRVLDGAVMTDRQALGDQQERLVCPSCHKVTPAGAFCARCGKPLPVRVAPDEDRVRIAGEPQESKFTVNLPDDRSK